MTDRYAVGIDLGTSTSEVCIYRTGRDPFVVPDPIFRSPIVPSLLALDKQDRLLVGEAARAFVDMENRGIRELKRLMGTGERVRLGDKEYAPEELSAHILVHLKGMASEHLGEDVQDVAVTIPANFTDVQKKATANAAKIAGLNVIRWTSEPTAAALAFGSAEEEAEGQILVFDFGGGTLDITILEMMEGVLDVRATFGDSHLGGKDFDEAMAQLLVDKFCKEEPSAKLPQGTVDDLKSALGRTMKSHAESAKKALSKELSASVLIESFASNGNRPVDMDLEVTREEYESAIAPLLKRAHDCLKQALKAKETRPSSIDKVLLVGGTTYIPAVKRLVAETLPVPPEASVDPDLAVSIGASIRSAIAQDMVSVHVVDVCSHGFGIDVVTGIGNQLMPVYEQLIAPNTAIPYSIEREYSLLSPDQRAVEVALYQSHDGSAQFLNEAQQIQAMVIEDIPPALYGDPHPVRVEFGYSIDGLIELKAWIPGLNKSCVMRTKPFDGALDESELVEAAERVLTAWKDNPRAARYEALIARADGVMEESADEGVKQRISEAIAKLKISLAEGNDEDVQASGDLLTDLLFDLSD